MTSIEARRAELIFFSLLNNALTSSMLCYIFTHNLFDILADNTLAKK